MTVQFAFPQLLRSGVRDLAVEFVGRVEEAADEFRFQKAAAFRRPTRAGENVGGEASGEQVAAAARGELGEVFQHGAHRRRPGDGGGTSKPGVGCISPNLPKCH